MLSRERVTSFTQVCSDLQVKLHLDLVFKGGTHTHLHSPAGVNDQGTPKGSSRIEQTLGSYLTV